MTESLEEVERGIETALRRAAEEAKRESKATGVPLVRNKDGKVIKVRIEADGSEVIV